MTREYKTINFKSGVTAKVNTDTKTAVLTCGSHKVTLKYSQSHRRYYRVVDGQRYEFGGLHDTARQFASACELRAKYPNNLDVPLTLYSNTTNSFMPILYNIVGFGL